MMCRAGVFSHLTQALFSPDFVTGETTEYYFSLSNVRMFLQCKYDFELRKFVDSRGVNVKNDLFTLVIVSVLTPGMIQLAASRF